MALQATFPGRCQTMHEWPPKHQCQQELTCDLEKRERKKPPIVHCHSQKGLSAIRTCHVRLQDDAVWVSAAKIHAVAGPIQEKDDPLV